MSFFEELTERRIAHAMARGEFDNLQGAGCGIELEEDPLVPEDMRMAYRVLKNAGFAPAEVSLRKQILDLERQLADGELGPDTADAWKRLALLRTHLNVSRGAHEPGFTAESQYCSAVVERLTRSRD